MNKTQWTIAKTQPNPIRRWIGVDLEKQDYEQNGDAAKYGATAIAISILVQVRYAVLGFFSG